MIALVFATDKERDAALAGSRWAGSFSDGLLPDHPGVRVQVVGVGPVKAAFNLGVLLGRYPETTGVICLGIGGTFSLHRYPLGSTCVITSETWPEYGLFGPDRVHPEKVGFPLGEQDGTPIWDTIALNPDQAARSMGLALSGTWARTSGLTVAGVSATPGRAAFMRRTYRPGVENMEGFSLALGCHARTTSFLEIRTISNLVGSRDPKHWRIGPALKRLGPVLDTLFCSAKGLRK